MSHLGQFFVRGDIDVRLGDTNVKEASLESALDSSATALEGVAEMDLSHLGQLFPGH